MATFKAGYTYANRDFLLYGTNKSTVVTNEQFAGYEEYDWFCTSVTRTFAVFTDDQNVVRRLRIYRDQNGSFVYPRGRFPQAPVLRAEYAYNNGTLVSTNDDQDPYGQGNATNSGDQ
jgi:hypothetical protein